MYQHLKIISVTNLIAVLIPLFFLTAFLMNPTFGDPLLVVALLGQLLIFVVIIAALPIVILRKEFRNKMKNYLAFGILSFVSGIAGLVTQVASGFDAASFYWPFIMALFLIGIFIMTDTCKYSQSEASK